MIHSRFRHRPPRRRFMWAFFTLRAFLYAFVRWNRRKR